MTTAEFARLVGAKKTGKGKYIARCPAHRDRRPSMTIAEGRQGVLVRCMSQQCDTKAILDALGLKWGDLFYNRRVTQEVRQRLSDEAYLETLERRLGLADMMVVLEPQKRHYWEKAIENIEQEVIQLRRKIYPDKRLPIRLRGTIRYGIHRTAIGARKS
jgi:hypothetical protein